MKKLILPMAICGALFLAACEQPQAKSGDTVVINFAGFLDGVQFPGGTAEGFPLRLGSGQFIPGFEDQLIGAKKGEERDVVLSFPEEYHAAELAGKEVTFRVKVLDIKR